MFKITYVYVILFSSIYILDSVNTTISGPKRDSMVLGIIMCRRKCFTQKGCNALQFDTKLLHCELLEKIPEEKSTSMMAMEAIKQMKKPVGMCNVKQCEVGRRCIQSKAGHTVCHHTTAIEKAPQARYPKGKLLLYRLRMTGNQNVKIYKLQSNTSYNVSLSINLIIESMVYAYKLNALLICFEHSVYICPKQQSSCSVWKNRTEYKKLVVDEDSEYAFAADRNMRVYQINMSNKATSRLEPSSAMPAALAICSQCKRVYYVSDHEGCLIAVSYDDPTEDLKKYQNIHHADDLTTDGNQALYYIDFGKLHRLSLKDSTVISLSSTENFFNSVTFYNNKIYMNQENVRNVVVVDVYELPDYNIYLTVDHLSVGWNVRFGICAIP